MSSGNGDVTALRIAARSVILESGNGDVTAQLSHPALQLTATSGNGDVTLSVPNISYAVHGLHPRTCSRRRASISGIAADALGLRCRSWSERALSGGDLTAGSHQRLAWRYRQVRGVELGSDAPPRVSRTRFAQPVRGQPSRMARRARC
ncbi:MAG: hypothetical protein ACLP01_14155 [Solirubrobacteraceae bacterium]